MYCVGSREPADKEGCHSYCSRFCCAATVAASVELSKRDPRVHQYHLYRDMRTYGSYELMYTESRKLGSVYLKFDADDPPQVVKGPDGRLTATVRDVLTGERVAIPADLVVLVTGMVPRGNEALTTTLKLPLGADGFYNEIHPKLRPVETTVDGVYIAGACQGPRNSAESVASGLATVTQSAVILKKGYAELDPLVAIVHADACTGCGECLTACPYLAIEMSDEGEAQADRPDKRDDLQGLRRLRAALSRERDRPARLHRRPDHFNDRQPAGGKRAMNGPHRDPREVIREEPIVRRRILDAVAEEPRTVPDIATDSLVCRHTRRLSG